VLGIGAGQAPVDDGAEGEDQGDECQA